MSDKFQFIKDAIESSLKIENQQSRERIEEDTQEYIEDAIDNPNQWRHNYSVKDKLQEKIKQYQTECDDKLYSLKEDTYNQWDYSVWSLIPDKDDARISEKERNCILGFETSHYQFDEYVSNLFDDDEITKLDNDELNSLHNKLLYSVDLLYKNGSKEFKQQYRQALDNVSLFSSEVNLDKVLEIKKQKEILSSLDEYMDYSFPNFLEEFNHYEQEINEHFPDLVSLVDDIKSNLKSEDIFNQTSNETIFNLVDDNERFWNWFHTDESNANSLSYRLSMKDDDIPRLFYRGMNYIPDMDNVEVGSYSADGYNADYFSNRAVVGASYLDIADNDEDMGDPRLFSGFLRPADNPFVVPCNPKTVENWFQVKTANWNSVLQHYNMYQAMCLFEMAGFDNEITKGDWQDAFGDKKVVDCETHYYTDAEQDDEGEWTKPVKVFTFFDLEKETGNLKAYDFVVNENYTEDDFRGKDGEIPLFVNETKLLISTNDMKANIQAQGRHDRVYFLDCTDIGGGTLSDAIPTTEQRSMIVAAWNFDNTSYGKSYFKEVRNNGNFDPTDNRIFYSLFDIEEDFKQEVKTEKEKTMENQVSGSPKAEQEPYTPKYNKYIADYIRDFVNDDSNFTPIGEYKYEGVANWYYLEQLANRNGGIEHFAKLFDQYKSRNRLEMGQTWRYRYMNETIEMLRNPVAYQDKLEKSISGIQQRVTELYAQIDQENVGTEKRDDLKSIKDGLLRAVGMENKRLAVVKDYLQTQQHRQEKQMNNEQTQTTAANGGFSSPENVSGSPEHELTRSVATYFNTPERQELVLAFLQTAERSKDLRQQAFLGISYQEQKQFDRIAAFSPLELSAILDCKPEFANNMREYMAVVADFEQNHQQKLVDFDKALKALRITPKYQAASSRNRIFDENDLRREYIDGGKAFAFAKNGDKTNGDRLKQAMTNAIETIAPAVKYSLDPKEFWQERDDLAFIVRPKIEQMLQKELGVAAQHIQVKTLYQAYKDNPTAFDGLSSRSATSGFYSANNNSITMIADAFVKRPELAIWTAYHELGHRGVAVQGRALWEGWLNATRKNDTVRAIADNIQTVYASKGLVLSDIKATEEALVEVFAAYKTQKWDFLAQRHNLEIPQDFRKPQGTAERLWQTAKQRIGQIFGRQPEKLPDSAVFAMLGKLEQSLYQYPEWKQVLERTTEQRNPFIRPTHSGSPRVNPTALANRYRSGGLRFDLNVADDSDFAKAVDDIANGGSASKKHITLGTTPEVLAMIGLPETRINIRVDTIQKAMGEHLNLQDHSHSHIHNLTPETLKQIPEQLNNPIAAMKSAQSSSNPNGFVVLTELTETDSKTGKDKPVVAILDLHPTNQGLEVITVRSVYGRSLMQVEKGLTNDLLYLHTTKGSQFVKDFGLRLPSDALSTANLVRHNFKTNEDLLQYRKDKEMQKNENTPENAVKHDLIGQPEKDNQMNETEKQALAQAFKALGKAENPYVRWQIHKTVEKIRNQPESEIVAALGWDEFATAVKDYVDSQSDMNIEKLYNAYMAYPMYNELANKGIPANKDLQDEYARVVRSDFSSFHERRTAALFVLQSTWKERGNSTSITRSYNIDAMTAYIARSQKSGSVDKDYLTKDSIFTHKNLREMGLDNNPDLAPYAPELLQAMVKIERQYTWFSDWKAPSEDGWYYKGAENIIDFKQIPASVQKDLILMGEDRYSSKRDMFSVYDDPVIGMQNGLANRKAVEKNLELLIKQQEKQWQEFKEMGFGVSVPQEDAITQQISTYKEVLEQVKNAPAVAFVPETVFVSGSTKPDWQISESLRFNTMEINTKTGEITFVQDKNNPNPNPFGEMSEQARQYLSANNNFALASLGVAPKEMPENLKYDLIGQPETVSDSLIQETLKLAEKCRELEPLKFNGHNRNSFIFNDLISRPVSELGVILLQSPALKESFERYIQDNSWENLNYLGRCCAIEQPDILRANPNVRELSDFAMASYSATLTHEQRIKGALLYIQDYWKERGNSVPVEETFDINAMAEYIVKQYESDSGEFTYNTKPLEKIFGSDSVFRLDNPKQQEQGVSMPTKNVETQPETVSGSPSIEQQRIEKREQIFDMLYAVHGWNNIKYESTPMITNDISAPIGNMVAMIGRFDEKTGDLSYKPDWDGSDTIFVINTDKISARTAAVAFLRGYDEYRAKFVYGKTSASLTPAKRRDIQEKVNLCVFDNQRMENIVSHQVRREINAEWEEKYPQQKKEQTAEQGGFSSPENGKNAVKHDLNPLSDTETAQQKEIKDMIDITQQSLDKISVELSKATPNSNWAKSLQTLERMNMQTLENLNKELANPTPDLTQIRLDAWGNEKMTKELLSIQKELQMSDKTIEQILQRNSVPEQGDNAVKHDLMSVPENPLKVDTSLPFDEQYKQYQLAEERISQQYSSAEDAARAMGALKGFSGYDTERHQQAIAEESKFAKQLDDLRQANPEFALMVRAKDLDPKDMTPELRSELQRVNEWIETQKNLSGKPEQAAEVKHDLMSVPETPKTLTLSEQALKDGDYMTAADEKVRNAEWELAKQPNNSERQQALKTAQAERVALHDEIKQRVSDAMAKGEPFVIRYDEVPSEPFNGSKAPIELVVTEKGNLRIAIGTADKPHNLAPVDSTPEIALNTEQRSTPERVAEVLKQRFNAPKAAIPDKIACINYPNADKVFSENEIKDALNKALKSSFQAHQTAAIKSPVMRAEWLEHIATSTKVPEPIRQAAKNEMAERFGTAEVKQDALSQPETAKKQTADKGGVSLGATQQNALQQAVVAQKVMQSQTTVKSHRMRH